ncbi:hypothetical protein CpipJ_CPIJ018723 [Culex quinquefasciatus]|nr:hypothetical protein CpipJ_CPIJ018723 [Culex quinquefasciatus]|eukprot:XP_001868878.1 hypothetical protein CpipJ_CPIJ018723 [Culex quinquefasciatus]
MAILPSKKHNRCNPVITPGTGRSVNDRGL